MDQQHWQNIPQFYSQVPQPQPPPNPNNSETIMNNSCPYQLPHPGGIHSGNGWYHDYSQSSGSNNAVYNVPSGAAAGGTMTEPYNSQRNQVTSEPFYAVPSQPMFMAYGQSVRAPIYSVNNSYVNTNVGFRPPYPCSNNREPTKNNWPNSESLKPRDYALPAPGSNDFFSPAEKELLKNLKMAEISNLPSQKITPENKGIIHEKSQGQRAGSPELSRNCSRRRSSRSPKRSISPKPNRESSRPRKTFRSPPPPRSKQLYHNDRSSKNKSRPTVVYGSKLKSTKRDGIVERRSKTPNQGRKETKPKETVDLTALIEKEKLVWIRSAPADLFYTPGESTASKIKMVNGTNELVTLCNDFEECLLKKAETIRAGLPKYEPLERKKKISVKKHKDCHGSSSSCTSSGSEEEEEDCTKEELEHKKKHPLRLHQELWFNDPGEMNDGPLCRCSAKAQRSGIRHNIYAGENHLPPCDPNSNNANRLHHYRITISPSTNFVISKPTIIEHDEHEYIFEGFSMFSHKKLDELPLCKVIRFNIEYTIVYYEENFPQNFTVRELNLFHTYLFREILELVDLDLKAAGDSEGCPQYHFMPRFVRGLPGNGKEILPMNEVLKYLLNSAKPLIPKEDLANILKMPQYDWQRFTESVKGMLVTYPGKKPSSLRVDQLDRDQGSATNLQFPEIVHFGIRPPQLSYAGNPEYQKAWREYVKFRHLLANMPKPSFDDKGKLESKENKLQSMRTKSELRRNVTVTVSSENFFKTGIMCDVVQHGMLIPVLVAHLRFHRSLDTLEEKISYKFSNRFLLQLALTHPSYRENFGTNPDHARNSLTNCGIRQPVYGDRKIHYQNTRKRGINTLINIMSRFGKKEATESEITHNERLEFLGDAVVEFSTSVHLFHLFPDLEEGGLATYRAAIVQNQHLAVLAKTLGLEEFMLYAHGSDLCHDLELRHAMANCFEALMGALFLDGGIEVADKVFGEALFHDEEDLLEVWVNYPPHPLQEQEPLGDRKWISTFAWLQHLTKFEDSIGVQFNHIRLLARAFTDRSMGYTNLTLGSNQRLEFLGDTVLQLIASDYLYKHFPEHHEGHLSLLRSSLVNNGTQSVVCNDLDLCQYAKYSNPKAELKIKDRADLLEALLGALYVDQDLEYCQVFCDVCFFPRLKAFIMNQDWNDPKSKLQQCCLTLRTMEGGEPEIPIYKVIECKGPTNTRVYTVAVYFKNRRLAKASGHSIQDAEMNAATNALLNSHGLFPQLDHQKRVISKSMNRQKRGGASNTVKTDSTSKDRGNRKSPSSNTTKKSADDVFSQKIRCRTPPLAYRSRNKSPSPALKTSDKTGQKTSKKVQDSRSQSKSPCSSDKKSSAAGHTKTSKCEAKKITSKNPPEQSKEKNSEESQKFDSFEVESTKSGIRNISIQSNQSHENVSTQRDKRLAESGRSSNHTLDVPGKNNSMKSISRERQESRSREQSYCRQTTKRRSRSTSKGKEFKASRKSRSPSYLKNCQKPERHLSGAPKIRPRSRSPSSSRRDGRDKTQQKKTKHSPTRTRSPPVRSRTPLRKVRSPPLRIRRTRSPPYKCRRIPSTSPPRAKRSLEKDNQTKMADFIEEIKSKYKGSSPVRETKSQSNASWLIDMMFDQSNSIAPQPLRPSPQPMHPAPQPMLPTSQPMLPTSQPMHPTVPGYSQAVYNSQTQNMMQNSSMQLHYQGGNWPTWQNTQYLNQQGGSNIGSFSNASAPIYPPPPYPY